MVENNILIVDDEASVVAAIKRVLMDDHYNIFSAGSAAEGLEVLKKQMIHVVLSDEKMPGMQGAEFLALVRRQFPDIIRIMLTGHASMNAAMKAINECEIYRFLLKPWDDLELRLTVQSAADKYNLEDENRKLLKVIKQQALDIKLLEREFPEIATLERDKDGRIILPDITEDELAQLITQIENDMEQQ